MKGSTEVLVGVKGVCRGHVVGLGPDAVWVSIEGEEPLACDRLRIAAEEGISLRVGDEVLVALPGERDERGCVLGRVESWTSAPERENEKAERRISGERLLIEAGTSLEIRVGESRIQITEKGDIILSGNNLLSRARRLNKIRGAAVNIN